MSSKSTDKETKSVAEAADVKEAKAVKADAKPESDTAVKETKAAGKKAEKDEAKAAKKPAAKKSTAKKTEKPELKPEVFIEYQNQQTGEASVVEKVKAAFVASGHRVSSIKSLQIYIKPEEFKAYYVINDNKYSGEVDLF